MSYHLPPAHSHGLFPQDILDLADMEFLTRHFAAWLAMPPDEDPDKGMKAKFTPVERRKAAAIYELMREHGMYPSHIDVHGSIAWKILLRSQVDLVVMEGKVNGATKRVILPAVKRL